MDKGLQLYYSSGSQPEVLFLPAPPLPTLKHLAMSGHILLGRGVLPLESRGERSGMMPNIL